MRFSFIDSRTSCVQAQQAQLELIRQLKIPATTNSFIPSAVKAAPSHSS